MAGEPVEGSSASTDSPNNIQSANSDGTQDSRSDAARLLDLLGPGWRSLCARRAGGGRFHTVGVYDTSDVLFDAAGRIHTDHDLWVGVHPLTGRPSHGRGGVDDVAIVHVLPVDLDWCDGEAHKGDDLPSEEQVRVALDRMTIDGLAPTAVVHSGHGLQAYWALSRPVAPNEGEVLTLRLHAMLNELGVKAERADLASILRLPGSTNFKATPVKVQLESLTGVRFDPEHLDRRLSAVEPKTPVVDAVGPRLGTADGPADRLRLGWEWPKELEAVGWQYSHTDHKGDIYYTRPGKPARDGHSAVLHLPDGPFIIWSNDAELATLRRLGKPIDGDGVAVTPFQFLAACHHGGDMSAAASALSGDGALPDVSITPDTEGERDGDDFFVDASTMFAGIPDADAVVDGIVYPGRWTAIVAPAKQGKSSFVAHMAHRKARGLDPFDGTTCDPMTVGYIDTEMGRTDMADLLTKMGVTDAELQGHWRYSDTPPKINTVEGAARLIRWVERHGIKWLIIDGLNGVIVGAEKDDIPWRDLYEMAIRPLKRLGVAVLTTDNTGREHTNRSRGSAAKPDKVDVEMVLKRTDQGCKLTVGDVRRSAVFLKERDYEATFNADREPIEYRPVGGSWPAGTGRLADELDRLGIPVEWGRPKVLEAIKDKGVTAKTIDLAAAIKYRKNQPSTVGTHAGTRRESGREQTPGTHVPDTPPNQGEHITGTHGNTPAGSREHTGGVYEGTPPCSDLETDPEQTQPSVAAPTLDDVR